MPESEYSRAQNYDDRFLRAVGAILALPSPDGVRVREGVSGRGFSSHWRRAEWGEERGGESADGNVSALHVSVFLGYLG